jgi:ABC-type lipoprotein release transport system permease subunit
MLSVAMRGMQLGTYEVNIRHVVELFSGYIQIQADGYQKNPSLQKSFPVTEGLQALLAGDSRIAAFAPRVIGDGLVSFRDNSQGAAILGVAPEQERRVSNLATRVTSGHFLNSGASHEIVVGYNLIENLKASLGDEVVVLSQGFDGSLGNLKFTIVGTIKTGSDALDRNAVLMTLDAAQELLVLYGRVSFLALRLNDLGDIPDVQEPLRESLRSHKLAVLAWNEVMPDLEQSIKLDNVSGILMLGILVIVVGFGITNTVLMSVTERFREFGIVLSIGMQQQRLVILVLIETLVIVLIGLLAGNILAYGINSYIASHPIEFTGEFAEMYEEYGWLPRLEATVRFSSFLNTTLSMLAISILAAVYPLLRVFKLEPLKGIRHT